MSANKLSVIIMQLQKLKDYLDSEKFLFFPYLLWLSLRFILC